MQHKDHRADFHEIIRNIYTNQIFYTNFLSYPESERKGLMKILIVLGLYYITWAL